MALGVGIDLATISDVERLWPAGMDATEIDVERLDPFFRKAFTATELAQALGRAHPAEYLAGRFAVKEAAFKALAPRTHEGFDFRFVECLDDEYGAPHITLTGAIEPVLAEAGASELLVSITNEGDLAAAVVIAQ